MSTLSGLLGAADVTADDVVGWLSAASRTQAEVEQKLIDNEQWSSAWGIALSDSTDMDNLMTDETAINNILTSSSVVDGVVGSETAMVSATTNSTASNIVLNDSTWMSEVSDSAIAIEKIFYNDSLNYFSCNQKPKLWSENVSSGGSLDYYDSYIGFSGSNINYSGAVSIATLKSISLSAYSQLKIDWELNDLMYMAARVCLDGVTSLEKSSVQTRTIETIDISGISVSKIIKIEAESSSSDSSLDLHIYDLYLVV